MPRKLVLFRVLWPVPFYRGRPGKLGVHWLPWHILEPFLKEKSFSSLPLRNKPHSLSNRCQILVYLRLPSPLPLAVYATAFRTMFLELCLDDDESRRVCADVCRKEWKSLSCTDQKRWLWDFPSLWLTTYDVLCLYTSFVLKIETPWAYSFGSTQGKITTRLFA